MFYRVRVSGVDAGVFGHPSVENINLSVGGDPSDRYFFASAVCNVDGKQVFFDWIQRPISATDVVEIAPTTDTAALTPRHTFVMNRSREAQSADRQCDFCQRKETAVTRLVDIDQHRPAICSDCIQLCSAILEEKET